MAVPQINHWKSDPQITYWKSILREPSEEDLNKYKRYVCITKIQQRSLPTEEIQECKHIEEVLKSLEVAKIAMGHGGRSVPTKRHDPVSDGDRLGVPSFAGNTLDNILLWLDWGDIVLFHSNWTLDGAYCNIPNPNVSFLDRRIITINIGSNMDIVAGWHLLLNHFGRLCNKEVTDRINDKSIDKPHLYCADMDIVEK